MVEFIILDHSLTESEFETKVASLLGYAANECITTLAVVPSALERAAVAIGSNANISLASLSLSAASTYTEVAILECAMALENGADEIVIPLNIGSIKQGDVSEAVGRIEVIAEEISGSALLSVYIDSSKFSSFGDLKVALDAAIQSGADSITMNVDCGEVAYLGEVSDYLLARNVDLDRLVSLKVVISGSIDNCDAVCTKFIAKHNLGEIDCSCALKLLIQL